MVRALFVSVRLDERIGLWTVSRMARKRRTCSSRNSNSRRRNNRGRKRKARGELGTPRVRVSEAVLRQPGDGLLHRLRDVGAVGCDHLLPREPLALTSGRRMVQAGRNAKEIMVPKIEVTGLGDYTRNVGYKTGSITYEFETKTFNYDYAEKNVQPRNLHTRSAEDDSSA